MKFILRIAAVVSLCAQTALAQHFVIAPKPKVDFFLKETKPGLQQSRFDSGWLARAHWASTAFDFSTTGHASETCHGLKAYSAEFLAHYCGEADPLARPFIGNHSNPRWRLALAWADESIAVSLIPNRKIRRAVQMGLIATHITCGVYNIHAWH